MIKHSNFIDVFLLLLETLSVTVKMDQMTQDGDDPQVFSESN